MGSTVFNVAFDCANPYELAAFWEQVVGHPRHPEDRPGDAETVIALPTGMNLHFNRVPEGKVVKNRVHVCLRPDQPRDAEVERLLALGARLVSDERNPDGTGWAVLADPEDNEFCLLR
ncbi:VOC family protein [Allokutzneria multivorans]|uniref:VOC family protein n=1 Tax=Allokutzneria multivorans TaxID=1142134 RepID=A0ABP7T2Z3_9PSEU